MPERLNDVLDERLRKEPEARCLWWKGAWGSRREFQSLADGCTRSLKDAGFGPGQRLAVMMPNSPMTEALALAAWRLGGSFCPLNEKAGAASLLKTLDLLRPFAVVVSEGVSGSLTEAIRGADLSCALFPTEGTPPALTGRPAESEAEDLAVIFSTSGTTGDPKAVPITHANLLDQCRGILEAIPTLSDKDSFLTVLPNFHAFGLTVSMLLPLYVGASQVVVPGFMPPQNTLRAIQEAHPSILPLVPTMLNFILALLERSGQKAEGVRLLIAGGDRYNPQMDGRVKAAFGVGVLEGYGITECSPVLAANRVEEGFRLGTVGRPLPRFELQLRTEAGAPTEAGEGVLWVRGPSVTAGYYHAPELNRERFDHGWFNTGDYVRIEDGYITILDRVTDIIIVGGFNVYPQEVEAMLSQHPAVQTAIVVGMPNDISGEVPKAFVIKDKDAQVSASELIRFCKARLAHYKVPREVEFVEELPLSSTGKVLRRVLRQQERDRAQR